MKGSCKSLKQTFVKYRRLRGGALIEAMTRRWAPSVPTYTWVVRYGDTATVHRSPPYSGTDNTWLLRPQEVRLTRGSLSLPPGGGKLSWWFLLHFLAPQGWRVQPYELVGRTAEHDWRTLEEERRTLEHKGRNLWVRGWDLWAQG